MSQSTLAEHKRDLILKLRQGSLRGSSFAVAFETVKYLRRLVAMGKFAELEELVGLLRDETRDLVAAGDHEAVVGNVALRSLKVAREEWARLRRGGAAPVADPFDSMHSIWAQEGEKASTVEPKELRSAVIESLSELMTEMEVARESMAEQAGEYIEEGETVLTLGSSRTVEAFLKAAGKRRRFRLVVVLAGPTREGEDMVERLRTSKDMAGVEMEAVGDEWICARMATANKVLLTASSVLADGGCVGCAGAHALALAARHAAVPVLVAAGFYKLTPRFLWEPETQDVPLPPRFLIPSTQGDLMGKVDVISPTLDYVPPELVSLYITHTSGYAPSYIYRLINEQCHPDDICAEFHGYRDRIS